jgi:uncharacterized protein YutE (UPF0331/DUF86 family)
VVSVDRERIKRFISEVRSAISFISKCSERPFEELTDSDKYAIRYNIIVIAEALSAIALHICRNIYGLEPETPIHALKLLADKNLIQRSLSEELLTAPCPGGWGFYTHWGFLSPLGSPSRVWHHSSGPAASSGEV